MTVKNLQIVVALIVGLSLFQACSVSDLAVKVNSAQADSFNSSAFKTYNWFQPSPQAAAAVKAPYNTQLASQLQEAVEAELQKRGFTKTAQSPDFLVAFDISQPNNVGANNTYSYMLGYRYTYDTSRLPGYKPVTQYPANSLFIDIIDPKDNALIWRGYSENVIESYKLQQATVQNLVDDILDKLTKTH